MAGNNNSSKPTLTVPTSGKSIWGGVKKAVISPAGSGLAGGLGQAAGEAFLGEELGPMAGNILGSLFTKNEIDKRILVVTGTRETVMRIME